MAQAMQADETRETGVTGASGTSSGATSRATSRATASDTLRDPMAAPADPMTLPADPVALPPDGYMTAEMIASALAKVTGKRAIPASTIRGMASRDQLPAPSARKWGRRNLWCAQEIESWLAQRESRHVPRATVRQIQRRLTAIDEQSRITGNDARLKQAVRSAYRRGLSFQQIADAIKVKNGDHHPSREAVRLRFGRYL